MNSDAEQRSLSLALLIEGSAILFFGHIISIFLPPENRFAILWSFFVGAVFIVCGFLSLTNRLLYDRLQGGFQRVANWYGVSALQAFLFLTSPIFAILTIHAAGFWSRMYNPSAAISAWLIGILLAIVGAWHLREEQPRFSRQTLFWFVMVTIVAFLFRGIGTGEIPILLTGDEASAGVSAKDFAVGAWNNIFISSWFSFPSLYAAIQSIAVRILGNTVEALRIPSALAGALTVGVTYVWGKAMFGQRAALFAALVLAALHFHIHFSRLGLNNIWDGLWFTLTLGALWYGWSTKARWAYVLAGIGLGFSQYFYASGKALVGLLLLAAFLIFLFRRAQFRDLLPGLVVTFVIALVIILPLLWHYIDDPRALWAPYARVSMLRETFSSGASFLNFLFQRIPISLGAYAQTDLATWYLPGTPILRPLPALFFYLGLIYLLFAAKDSRSAFLIAWLVTFALLNALSSYTPASQRYIAAAPACALIVGYGLERAGAVLEGLWSRRKIFIEATLYILLAGIVVSDLLFYFVEYTASTYLDEATSNGMVAYQFAEYLTYQQPDTQVVVFGTPRLSYDSPALLYLAPQPHRVNAPQDWKSFDQTQLTSERIVFVFLPEYRDEIGIVETNYPGGTLIAQNTSQGGILFWVYEYASP